MNWKYYLIFMGIFIIGVLLILTIGLNQKEKLNNETPNINSLEDVEGFIDSCNQKLFLDCDELLKRKIRSNSNG